MKREVLLAAFVAGACSQSAGALSLQEGPYIARAVTLESFAGILRVAGSSGKEVRFSLEGPEKVISGTRSELVGDRLTIRVPQVSSGSNTVVRGEVSAVASGGGTASVTIGGDTVANDEPAILNLEVPPDSELVLLGFVGDGVIAVPLGALRAELAAGSLSAGSAGPADLSIQGGGSIEVDSVSRQLTMTVRGGGDITVHRGSVQRVEVVLDGAGSLGFGGDAMTGRVRASGAGAVTLGTVSTPPEITQEGAVDVTVGGTR